MWAGAGEYIGIMRAGLRLAVMDPDTDVTLPTTNTDVFTHANKNV